MSESAADLLRRFNVRGRFYRARLGAWEFDLRSHLELFEAGVGWPRAATADPDLVAVMMNPGGSRPLESLDDDGWAPALPDRTQYQLMKLALRAQARGMPIRHVRVINLSDLRAAKSAELFATLPTLPDDRHSIFSVQRRDELEAALGAASVPVLRAWGLSPALSELANLGAKLTSSRRVFGLTNNAIHYRHPLPQRADLQQRWLIDVGRQMDALQPR